MIEVKSLSWGPFGNVTREQIEKWWNLPHGEFSRMKKERTRVRKGKTQTERTIYATRDVIKTYYVPIKVMAYDFDDASKTIRTAYNLAELPYTEDFISENVRYGLQAYLPVNVKGE